MKKAPDTEFKEMKAFLGAWLERSEMMKAVPPEYHPLAMADQIAEVYGPSKAKQGLKMAINDCLEEAADLKLPEIQRIDEDYSARGITTLSKMRQLYSRKYKTILKRNKIKNEIEYYLIKGTIDSRFADLPEEETTQIEKMIREYEDRNTKTNNT